MDIGWGKRGGRKGDTVWPSPELSHSQPHTAPLMNLEQLGFLLVAEEDDCGVVDEDGAR